MKKQSKWLLVGSLMCLVVGSGFHQGYGMTNNNNDDVEEEQKTDGIGLPDEMILYIMTWLDPIDVAHFGETCQNINQSSQDQSLWKQKALKVGISKFELEKVNKGLFSYKQIVIGYECWNKFNKIKDANNVTNEEKLKLLKYAAENGCEKAILYLLNACRFGNYGIQEKNPEGLVLAQKYADLGSKIAIDHLLWAYRDCLYGMGGNDSKGLVLAQKYADLGNEQAIGYLLGAHLNGYYGLQANDPKGLVFAEKYADQGSEKAIDYLLEAYQKGWYGLQANDPEGLVLAQKYADLGSEKAIRFLKEHK